MIISNEVMALELNGSYGERALLMLVLKLTIHFLSQLPFSTSKLQVHNNWLNPLAPE